MNVKTTGAFDRWGLHPHRAQIYVDHIQQGRFVGSFWAFLMHYFDGWRDFGGNFVTLYELLIRRITCYACCSTVLFVFKNLYLIQR